MSRSWLWTLALGFLVVGPVRGQDEKFKSGLQPGTAKAPTKMPHFIEAHVFNGKNADRFHCLVCENDTHPTVLFLLKEPAPGKEAAIQTLFAKLDELVAKYQAMEKYPDVTFLQAYAIFLSPAAQSSLTTKDERPEKYDDETTKRISEKLVGEATARRDLYRRMSDWAGKTKKVVVGCALPEAVKIPTKASPEGYAVNPAAAATGLYYDSLNVLENFAFEELTEADVEPLLQRVEAQLQAKIAAFEAARKKSPLRKKT